MVNGRRNFIKPRESIVDLWAELGRRSRKKTHVKRTAKKQARLKARR
jgi:hypothetical protein